MTASTQSVFSGDKLIFVEPESVYSLAGKKPVIKLICDISTPATLVQDMSHVNKTMSKDDDQRTSRYYSLDTIRINTNRNMSGSIRYFVDKHEHPKNQNKDWDPIDGLTGMLSDCAASKEVLETLDELRDRFRQ